ncbi:hypothetical protein FMM05_00170 [Flavobacterium zepuense]|uniref:Uncharacterized protein n=1 Tax=Flavobacterium zepuense TaxID=2593302 RepID=A0A552V9G0_9FLAO|nr:hypothetical protein [Flavobacterium zepuense]TRW27101.1 hypothetical protein FMM05_00170 [Flavobacterium zepuense]
MNKSRSNFYLSIIAGTLILWGCSIPEMEILPIDVAFNRQMITKDGLDKRLFPFDEVFQYYEVRHASKIKADALRSKLLAYTHKHYSTDALKKARSFTVFFYKGGSLKGYKDMLYRSASQNAEGNLTDQNDNLLAEIRLAVLKDDSTRYIQTTWQFPKGEKAVMTSDTLTIQ